VEAQLAVAGGLAGVILEDLDCPCQDEKELCFQPVCPKGMFQCCFDCTLSVCDRHELGTYPQGQLYLSERGIPECLTCHAGDFCGGCDVYEECPGFVGKGSQDSGPRVSPPGSVLDRECQRCPDGFEADFVREKCVPPFRNECELTLLEICISGCKENPTNDECQEMECRIFCANDQKDSHPGCLGAHLEVCNAMNLPTMVEDGTNNLATTTRAPTIVLTDDSGIATVAPFRIGEKECTIKCNFARGSKYLCVSVLMLTIATFLAQFLHL